MRRVAVVMFIIFSGLMRSLACAGDDAHDHDRRRHDDHRVLKLYDARGQVVGRLASYQGGPGVYLSIDGAIVFAAVYWLSLPYPGTRDSARFQWSAFAPYSYSSTDCSGSPIIPPQTGPRPTVAIRKGPDVTLYIAGDTASAPKQILSVSFDGTSCVPPPGVDHMPPSTAPVPAFSAETTYSLTAHYPEPLTIGY